MGAGLDDDGRKVLRLDQYLDWGRRVSRTGLWWDGFMLCRTLPRLAYLLLYVQISGTGCRPHDASPPTSDETGPVSAGDEGSLHPGP